LLAGAAIFLVGIGFLEESLKQLSGRRFKLFLKKHTGHPVKAIAAGTIVTSFMQSSSVVNLLVLSLVGAGVIKMQHALAVMLGSNLGTTFTGWIVATFGFQLNIESFSLPLLAIGGITIAFSKPGTVFYQWCRFLIGFAFLFVGLQYMKESMEVFVAQTDLSRFTHYPLLFFVGIGLVLTSLVQSSSVTIALTLSALYANAIQLPMAAAIVLGAEIGTTLKLALASVNGLSAKKRVALGNILFNTISTIGMFLLLKPALYFITAVIGISNNLYALVFFQSFLNIAGIVLFFPFLNLFGQFLERRFREESKTEFLQKVSVADTDLAIEAMEKEAIHFIKHFIEFNGIAFELQLNNGYPLLHQPFRNKPILAEYENMKKLFGEFHQFYIRVQKQASTGSETERLDQLNTSIRNTMYAAKSLKDALPDLDQLRNSSNDRKFQFYKNIQNNVREVFNRSVVLFNEEKKPVYFEELTGIYKLIQLQYNLSLQALYQEGMQTLLSDTEISTLLNFNRSIITSQKSFLFALKDVLLQQPEALYFEEMPGFIR
jgi:phosphate:Na+ symporter